jgi:hypothetical protein
MRTDTGYGHAVKKLDLYARTGGIGPDDAGKATT